MGFQRYTLIIQILLILYSLPFLVLGAAFCSGSPGAPTSTTLSVPTGTMSTTPYLDGADVVMGTGTYPRAIKLTNGNLLGVYTSFANGENIITTVLSVDGGASWQPLGAVTSGVGDIDNPFLLQLNTGRVLCAFRNNSKDSAGNYTYYRITICYSDDNGATWAYLSTSAQNADYGLWEPFMRLSSVSSSVVQIYYSYTYAMNDQDVLMQTSADGGVTWSTSSTIAGAGITSRDGMVGVTSLPFGSSNLIAIFESDDTSASGTNLFTVRAVSSPDDGSTWADRRLVYLPIGPNNNAGAPQVINVSGVLVVSFMTDEDTSEHDWTNGADVKVITSLDGNNWGNKLTIFPVQTNWAGMLAISSNHFLVMADYSGAKSQLLNF